MSGANTAPGQNGDGYLRRLGERVRSARARRGMTRKILARDSGVSERYLAQLESGRGNISITLLRQIAAAMHLPVSELVREGPERPIEATLIHQILDCLSPEDLAEAHEMLRARFGAAVDGRRASRIALIGLRGAGKSTLGKRLAERLGVPFIVLGDRIERESGMSLSEIFSLYGQAAYRRYERQALERVLDEYGPAVIETGGSLASEPATYGLLLSACYTVWIKARPEEHMARVVAQGDMRPMAENDRAMEDLKRILADRSPLYAKADATVDTSGRTVEESLRDLVAAVPAATRLAAARSA